MAPYNTYKKNPDISPEPPSWFPFVVRLTWGISLLFDSSVTFSLSWVIFLDHQKVVVLYIFFYIKQSWCLCDLCRFWQFHLFHSFFFPSSFPLLLHILHHFSFFVPLICLQLKRIYFIICSVFLAVISLIWDRYECLGSSSFFCFQTSGGICVLPGKGMLKVSSALGELLGLQQPAALIPSALSVLWTHCMTFQILVFR